MTTLSRFVLLILLLNISVITLPSNSHATWFRWFISENGSQSHSNILDTQTSDLVESIEKIYKKSKNIVADEKRNDDKKETFYSYQEASSNDIYLDIYNENKEEHVNNDIYCDSIINIDEDVESLNEINNIVNQISSSFLQCDGYAYRIGQFFGLSGSDLETKKRKLK